MSKPQYPINLNIEGQPCLVVGGGEIAARKTGELVRCGAVVTVVSPVVCDALEQLAQAGRIQIRHRGVETDDIAEAIVVVAATSDHSINQWVSVEARNRRALVNVVDQPALCGFTAPAVVRRGLLTIAISTNGASPALSSRLRRDLSAHIGPEWEEVVEVLGEFRKRLLLAVPGSFEERRDIMARACGLNLIGITAAAGGKSDLEARLDALLPGAAGGDAEES